MSDDLLISFRNRDGSTQEWWLTARMRNDSTWEAGIYYIENSPAEQRRGDFVWYGSSPSPEDAKQLMLRRIKVYKKDGGLALEVKVK